MNPDAFGGVPEAIVVAGGGGGSGRVADSTTVQINMAKQAPQVGWSKQWFALTGMAVMEMVLKTTHLLEAVCSLMVWRVLIQQTLLVQHSSMAVLGV